MKETRLLRFEGYEFDLDALELSRGGRRIRLAPQPSRVLSVLLQRRGQIVGREELRNAVWDDDTFVQFDAGITFCIKRLRAVLGDDARQPRYIETLPTRGYRFVGVVEPPAADVHTAGAESPPQEESAPASIPTVHDRAPAPTSVESASHPTRKRRPLVAYSVVGFVAFTAFVWLAATAVRMRLDRPPRVESIVVLPLENVSGVDGQDFLADGLTDALIANLGKIGSLRVISRTSAMTYREHRGTAPEIARELNVDAIMDGSVQRLGERVLVNVSFIDARADRTLWTESYDRDFGELVGLENEVVRTVVNRIAATLTPAERTQLSEAPRVDARVYEAYVKGRYFWNRRNEADTQKAIELFQEATRIDPYYAPAYAGLADAYGQVAVYGWAVPAEGAWRQALQAADTALELDSFLADGHASRAVIAMSYEWDWARAQDEYERALALNPGYANGRHAYGYSLLLTGRPREAEAEMRRALEMDPLSPIINANIGFCRYVARDFDGALAHWTKMLDMHPSYRLLHGYMGMAYVGKGQYEDAVAQFREAFDLAGASSDMAVLAYTYARMGRSSEATALLDRLVEKSRREPVPAYYLALVYVGLDDKDRAFALLERALEERSGPVNELDADPMFDGLRDDPRFEVLLQRLGLGDKRAAANEARDAVR